MTRTADTAAARPAEAARTARTQAERTAQSDRAMLDAAVALILEHGIDKTTLAALGERAGYSRGLVTYRFGSKAGLFDAVCKAIGREWLTYLEAGVGDRQGIDAMAAALDAFFRFLAEQPQKAQVLHMLYCGATSPTAEFRETARSIHARQRDDVAAWIRAGIKDGTIRNDADPDSIAAQYVAYISGLTYLWVIDRDSIDFAKASDSMRRQLALTLAA